MFIFLLQTLFWIALSVAIGILIGWFIWVRQSRSYESSSRRNFGPNDGEQANQQLSDLKSRLADEKQNNAEYNKEIAHLKSQLNFEVNDTNVSDKNTDLKNNKIKLADKYASIKMSLTTCKDKSAELQAKINKHQKSDVSARTPTKQIKLLREQLRNTEATFQHCQAESKQLKVDIIELKAIIFEQEQKLSHISIDDSFKPVGLQAPENNRSDDLTKIKGVGPVLNKVLNKLGIFHFYQIAKFSPENILWVDDHIDFKGRIDRENWVGQAKILANGGETEFSSRI